MLACSNHTIDAFFTLTNQKTRKKSGLAAALVPFCCSSSFRVFVFLLVQPSVSSVSSDAAVEVSPVNGVTGLGGVCMFLHQAAFLVYVLVSVYTCCCCICAFLPFLREFVYLY